MERRVKLEEPHHVDSDNGSNQLGCRIALYRDVLDWGHPVGHVDMLPGKLRGHIVDTQPDEMDTNASRDRTRRGKKTGRRRFFKDKERTKY